MLRLLPLRQEKRVGARAASQQMSRRPIAIKGRMVLIGEGSGKDLVTAELVVTMRSDVRGRQANAKTTHAQVICEASVGRSASGSSATPQKADPR